jgi:hypothetical protein
MKAPLFTTLRHRSRATKRHYSDLCRSEALPTHKGPRLPCPGPMGPRHRPLADLCLEDLLVGFQRLARFKVVDLPPPAP